MAASSSSSSPSPVEGASYRCEALASLEPGVSAAPGSVLFALGVLGNGLALALLWQHRRLRRGRGPGGEGRPRASAFCLLACALVATDLLGKCLLSPIVLAAYARNRSLSALWPDAAGSPPPSPPSSPGRLCQLFAFLMAFFGLAPTALLLAMALECLLSLGHPYCYRRSLTRRLGALLTGLAGLLCFAFCALPLLGFGATVQYCPGSWCFIRMAGPGAWPYSPLYASLLALLVLAVAACNLATMRALLGLARRRPLQAPASTAAAKKQQASSSSSSASSSPEVGQLLLLALMTLLFTVCSLPVVIRAYVGAFAPDYDERADLTALRFFSVNSIVDPWVFIIFRTSVFRSWVRRLSWRLSSKKAPCVLLLETWQRKGSNPLQ